MSEEAPAWAKGHRLEFLRELAAPFAAEHKPLVLGAFGLVKEADVAAALEAREIIWTRCNRNTAQAVALFKVLRSSSKRQDFAGREIELAAGDLVVRAIAGSEEGKRRIWANLENQAAAIWVEDFIEGPAAKLWPELGLELMLTKVTAASELKGLWLFDQRGVSRPPPLPAWDAPALRILADPWLSPIVLEELLGEALAVDSWAQHYSGYNKRQSWTAIALHGFRAHDPGFIIKPAEMSRKWREEHPESLAWECGPTAALERFPGIKRLLGELCPQGHQRARLMRLSASGGELTRHADIIDPEAGAGEGKLARLHIPLQTSPGCIFRVWELSGQERAVHMPAGSLCYLDTRKPHAVVNPGDADRIHLVVDAWSWPGLRAMIGNEKGPSS